MKNRGIQLGGKIYSLRVAQGMTQEQLAAVLCVSPAAVSKWEPMMKKKCLWWQSEGVSCRRLERTDVERPFTVLSVERRKRFVKFL